MLLALLAILAFGWGSIHAGFVSLDDTLLITGNDTVKLLNVHTVVRAFTSYDPELYVPLTLLSYQLEHAVFGLNPVVFHSTNLLLHIGSSILLFHLARMLVGRDGPAFFVAAIFAVHPFHTEAVLWAAARKDVLSTFFFLLSLFFYEKGVRSKRGSLLLWSVGSFLLALMSKATVLMLPVVLLLLDWFSHRRIDRRDMQAKWPWFLLSVIFAVIAFFGKTRNLSSLSLFDLFLVGMKSAAFYLQKLFWPQSLSVVYEQTTAISIARAEFFVPLLIIIVLIALGVILRRYRMIPFGIAFFLVTVFPNFFNVWKNGMLFFASDRYAYIPSIGIFLIVGSVLGVTLSVVEGSVVEGRHAANVSNPSTKLRMTHAPLGIILLSCALLIPISIAQSSVWRNSESLYRHALLVSPQSTMLRNNLGDTLVRSDRMDEGLEEFKKAAEIDPKNIVALTNIGNILKERGDRKGAMEHYRRAAEAVPENPFPEHLMGHYLLGEMLIEDGKIDEGLAVLTDAAARGKNFAEPDFNLGLMYERQGRKDEAIAAFREAVTRDGAYLAARYHLAALLAERGKLDEAREHLEFIVSRNPRYEKAAEHLRNINALR